MLGSARFLRTVAGTIGTGHSEDRILELNACQLDARDAQTRTNLFVSLQVHAFPMQEVFIPLLLAILRESW